MVLSHWFLLSTKIFLSTASLRRFQGFARRPFHPIRVRSFVNSLISDLHFEMAGTTFLSKIKMSSFSSPTSSVVLHSLKLRQTLSVLQNFNNPTSDDSTRMPHHSFFLQCRTVHIAPRGGMIPLIASFLYESGSVTVCGNRFLPIQLP